MRTPNARDDATRAVLALLLLASPVACDGGPSEPAPNPADALPPSISITAPAHGAMLVSGTYEPSPVTVSGEACHESSPIAALSVNGASVTVSGESMCEPFSVIVDSPWGMTPITVVARNALGREATHVQAFLRGPRYFAPRLAADRSAMDSVGAFVRIMPQGFQKITQVVAGAAGPPYALGGAIPDPMANTEPAQPACPDVRGARTGYRINRGAVSVSTPSINFSVTNSQTLRQQMWFANVAMPITVIGYRKSPCNAVETVTVSGSVSAVVSGDIDLGIGVHPTLRGAVAEVTNVNGVTSAISLSLNLDGITFLSAAQKDEIVATIAAQYGGHLETDIIGVIQEKLGGEVGEVLVSMKLPDDGLDALGLHADLIVEGLEFYNNGVRFLFSSQIFPQSPRSGAAAAQGSIRSLEEVWPIVNVAADIVNDISADLVNQILWAAWQGGQFDAGDLTGTSGDVPGLAVAVRSLIPPVVMHDVGAGRMRVGWGDLQLTATIDPAVFGDDEPSTAPIQATAYANVVMEAALDYDSTAGAVVLSAPTLDVTVGMPNTPGVSLNETAVRTAIRGLLTEAAPGLLNRVLAATPIAQATLANFADWPAGTPLAVWMDGFGWSADFGQVQGVIPGPGSP